MSSVEKKGVTSSKSWRSHKSKATEFFSVAFDSGWIANRLVETEQESSEFLLPALPPTLVAEMYSRMPDMYRAGPIRLRL